MNKSTHSDLSLIVIDMISTDWLTKTVRTKNNLNMLHETKFFLINKEG